MDKSIRRVHVCDEDRTGAGVASPVPGSTPESPAETSSRSQPVRLQDADVATPEVGTEEGSAASQSFTLQRHEIEAVLDQKERDMALQFQRLREQVAQVLGGHSQPNPSQAASAFTGWQGQAARSTRTPPPLESPPRPERLGHQWSALGQPMMAALWKNRELENEHRRLLEEVARKRSELRALRPPAPYSALPQARSTPNLSAASSSVGPLSADAWLSRQGVLPLVQSTSSLLSGGSSTTTGGVGLLNGDSVVHSDPGRGGVSPATTSTPVFGLSLHGPEPEPGRLPEPALGSHPPQASHSSSSHEKGHHVRTDVQLNHKLLSLAESIGATASHEGSRSDSKKSDLSRAESKKSLVLGRSESVPACNQRGEPAQPSEPNRVEGCTPDVSGYGNPEVYRDWRKWYVDSQDAPGENGGNGAADSLKKHAAPNFPIG